MYGSDELKIDKIALITISRDEMETLEKTIDRASETDSLNLTDEEEYLLLILSDAFTRLREGFKLIFVESLESIKART